MPNQLTKQFKFSLEGKAIASFVLGIISLVPLATRYLILPSLHLSPVLPLFLQIVLFIIFIGTPLFSLIGLILGISSLKSPKRNFAIAGTVLCLIGLLVSLYYFLIY